MHLKHDQFNNEIQILDVQILNPGIRLIKIKCDNLEIGDTLTSFNMLGLYECTEIHGIKESEKNTYTATFKIIGNE